MKGLVVEGGGMRGAHSCGALWALLERGITDFDVVVGASAGACSAAFFVARQFDLFTRIWQDYLHGSRFIRFRNLSSRERSVLDLDYLIHDVFQTKEKLDVEAIRTGKTRFFIAATEVSTGSPIYFDARRDPILIALKASSAIPIAYRHPVVVNGTAYCDGGVSIPIPIQKAIDEGCDEVTVLLTRPLGFRKKKPLFQIVPQIVRKRYPALSEALARQHLLYNHLVSQIERGDFPCRLIVIRPGEPLPVRRLTTDREKILAAINQGFHDGMAALTSSPPSTKISVTSRG